MRVIFNYWAPPRWVGREGRVGYMPWGGWMGGVARGRWIYFVAINIDLAIFHVA